MTCYGWIPTLAGKEIFNSLCSEFVSSSERLPEELSDAVKNFVERELVCNIDKLKVLIVSNNLFDLKKSYISIYLQFNKHSDIERIIIVEGDFYGLIQESSIAIIVRHCQHHK